MTNSKRIFTLLICAVLMTAVFAGCSNSSKDKKDDKKTTAVTTTTELATDTAKLTGATAINLLKSYSAEELGLSDVKEDYQFMLGTTGSVVDGKKYIRAVAGAMVESGEDKDGQTTYQMKEYKTFLINYEGTKILVSNGDDKYDTIKIDKKKLAAVTTTASSTKKNTSTTQTTKKSDKKK